MKTQKIFDLMADFLDGVFKVVSHDVFYFTDEIVNVTFIGAPGSHNWVLIDTGLPGSAKKIINVAESIYGKNAKPQAIILTNGHFDHTGSLIDLLKIWKVNVYAHQLEFPYLCGEATYPASEQNEENNFNKLYNMLSPEPINITEILEALPADLSVPGLTGWKWIHTPGPTPGHVCYFRSSDKLLVAGDIFMTQGHALFSEQDTQSAAVSFPPPYLLMDAEDTKRSIFKLEKLKPNYLIAGHGTDIWGQRLTTGLSKVILNFESSSIPGQANFKRRKKTKRV